MAVVIRIADVGTELVVLMHGDIDLAAGAALAQSDVLGLPNKVGDEPDPIKD